MKLLKNPYACVVCQKSFSITAALLEHVKTQHIPLKSPETKNEKERTCLLLQIERLTIKMFTFQRNMGL